MHLKTYFSRSCESSAKRSIISVMSNLSDDSNIASRSRLYAYFLIRASIFREVLAGERSSRKLSSRTWCNSFSTAQCFHFIFPIVWASNSISDIIPMHCISFPAPSVLTGIGFLLLPAFRNSTFDGVMSFPLLSLTVSILTWHVCPIVLMNGHSSCVLVSMDGSVHALDVL